MSSAPADLRALRAYVCERTGLTAATVGIVGDRSHTGGYHLGRDRIYTIPPGRGDRDYSVRHARDKRGLTDDASAVDIGRHRQLVDLGHYLVAAAIAHEAGTADIAEIIAERQDGTHVYRWTPDGTTGRLASDELPHHLHVSYRRDSRGRDKVPLFRAFYQPEEDPTVHTLYSTGDARRSFAVGTPVYDQPNGREVSKISDAHVVYRLAAEVHIEGGGRWWLLDGGGDGPMRYVKAA